MKFDRACITIFAPFFYQHTARRSHRSVRIAIVAVSQIVRPMRGRS
jgi:hypothetical protein